MIARGYSKFKERYLSATLVTYWYKVGTHIVLQAAVLKANENISKNILKKIVVVTDRISLTIGRLHC